MNKLSVYISMLVGPVLFILSANAQQPKSKIPMVHVYFFLKSQFDKGTFGHEREKDNVTYSVTEEAVTPSCEHNGRNVIAAVYIGEDKNPEPFYSNMKLYYTFKLYQHKGSDPLNYELIGSYEVKAKLSRRRIWIELHPDDYGMYTVKVFRKFYRDPITEGTVVLNRDNRLKLK